MRNNNRVIAIFSTVGNTGTTNTAFSIALALSKKSKAKIGVLSLNGWDDSSDFYTGQGSFLDDLKPKLAGKRLGDEREMLERFKEVEKDRLYILGGNRNRRLERDFKKEEIEYLIDRTSEIFDVVLIDAGCHLDNAMSAQSIFSAGHHIVVLTQQPKALKKFKQVYEDILQPLSIYKQKMQFLVNQYQEKTYLLTEKQIAKELDVAMVTAVPFSSNGMLSELDNKILYSYTDPKYQQSLDLVAENIGQKLSLVMEDIAAPKKGLGKFFGK